MKRSKTQNLVLAALFLALGIVLPFLTAQIPSIGSMLLPMHIPVLICGYVCGWQYGLLVGLVVPLLRSVLFGMPPMLAAIPMAFELAVYGLATGLLYRLLKKNTAGIYIPDRSHACGKNRLGDREADHGRFVVKRVYCERIYSRSRDRSHPGHHYTDHPYSGNYYGSKKGESDGLK